MTFRRILLVLAFSCSLSLHAQKEAAPLPNYVAGGVMGTVIGLGLGQAINGNYAHTGWIFTTFEGVLGVGPMVAGLVLGYQVIKSIIPTASPGYFLSLKWISDLQHNKIQTSLEAIKTEEAQNAMFKKAIVAGGLLGFGILMFTAFRIWDIVDVWSTPISDPGDKKAELLHPPVSLVPYLDAEVTGLSLRF